VTAEGGVALPAEQDEQDREADQLLASLDRLSGHEPKLAQHFYTLFFEHRPEVTKLFGEHSLSEQEEMVRETLVSMVAYVEKEPWLQTNLEAMGKSHAEYGVEDRMYDWMVECMLDAVEQILGADCRDEYRPAWRSTLDHLTGVMRAAGPSAHHSLGSPRGSS
jgi:hemoglobin-like flavoprotein